MDPSSGMIDILLDKIRDREWHNVKPMKTVITRADSKEFIDRYNNQFDLIVASSVLNCIPETDQRKTVEALAQLLKTGGHFCHSDWPEEATEHPNGMTLDKVEQLYAGTGLSIIEAGVMDFFIGSRGDKTPVFFVVGTK
jgi:ubiquinone/menaquinone biosynthesis C-methylase UbiE